MNFRKALRLGLLATASLAAMTAPAFAAPLAAAVAAAASFVGASGLFSAVARIGISLAINFGLSLLSSALSGKPKGVGGSSTSVQIGAEVPRQIIFGRAMTSGRLLYVKGVGKKNGVLHCVYALSDWECDSLDKVWVAGVEKSLTSISVVGTEHVRYQVNGVSNKIVVKLFRGTAAQTADTELVTASADTAGVTIGPWTSNHKLVGVCYASVIFTYDKDDLPSLPQLQFQVKGAKLYDWRKDSTNGGSGAHRWNDATTWEWSGNPAVCDYNFRRGFFRSGYRILGMGVPSTDLLQPMYTAAANICDEALTEGGNSEVRYTCGVIVNDDAEFRVAIDAFRLAMAGDVVERSGQFGVIAGASYSSVMTITDDDMAADGRRAFRRKASRSDLYNAVTISYLNPVLKWDSDSLTPLTDAGWEASDGNERLTKAVDLPMVYKPYQARRIAKIIHNQSRRQAVHTGLYPARFSALEPGDWVTRQFTRDGYGTYTMKVTSTEETEPGWFSISMIEVAASDFTAPGGTIPVTTAPSITPHQKGPGTPGTPSLVESVAINADGAAISTVKASFAAATGAATYTIGVTEGAAAEVQRVITDLNYSFRATVGTVYQVRVMALDEDGRNGTWSGTASITPTGDTAAPGAPTSLSVLPQVYGFLLQWTNPSGVLDLESIEIYENDSNSFATSTLLTTAPASPQFYFRNNLAVGVTKYYWIKAKDRTGNVSTRYPAGSGVSATTLYLDGYDIETGSILASRIVVANTNNLVRDPDFQDVDYWASGGGSAISTDATPLAALNAKAMVKSANGNGTTSQTTGVFGNIGVGNRIPVVPGSQIRATVATYVTTGFTGMGRIDILWYKADGTASATTQTLTNGTSYRTVAAGSNIVGSIDTGRESATVITVPSDARFCAFRMAVIWSTTQPNAGNIYFGNPSQVELNTASLTVKGTITGDEIFGTTLSGIKADFGNVVAGKVTSANYAVDADGIPKAGFEINASTGTTKSFGIVASDIVAKGASFTIRPVTSVAPIFSNGIMLSDHPAAVSGLQITLQSPSAVASFSGASGMQINSVEFQRFPNYIRFKAGANDGSAYLAFDSLVSIAPGDLLPASIDLTVDGTSKYVTFRRDGTIKLIDYNASDATDTTVHDSVIAHKWMYDVERDPLNLAGVTKVIAGLGVSRRPFPWVIPACSKLKFKVWAAGGGYDRNAASVRSGPGAYVYAEFNVGTSEIIRAGDVLWLIVGQGGIEFTQVPTLGYGGAGYANRNRMTGGGGSFIFRHAIDRSNLLIAAGGGGAGRDDQGGSPGGHTTWAGGQTGSGFALMTGKPYVVGSSRQKSAGGGGYTGGAYLTNKMDGTDPASGSRGGKGGTSFVHANGLSTSLQFSAADGNGYATTKSPPNNSDSDYTANSACWMTRALVGEGLETGGGPANGETAGNGLIVIEIVP